MTRREHEVLELVARGRSNKRIALELSRLTDVSAIPGDITDGSHREALLHAAGDRLELLVNNASELGPSPLAPLARYPLADLRRVHEVNVIAPLALVQGALRLMTDGGVIIDVTSDAAPAALSGLGRLRVLQGRARSADRDPRRRATGAARRRQPIPATCARACSRRRSPARTSPIARRRADGVPVRVHVASRMPGLDDRWLELVASYPVHASGRERLWASHLDADRPLQDLLARHGAPIRYGYVRDPWPLDAYQNVYATTPGSSEMASAERPFTARLICELIARGVELAPVTLYTGLSSPERHEPPAPPEPFSVPAATARRVAQTRAAGGRVIAVGTTVARARIGRERSRRGAGPELLERSYREALAHRYLWHEFGDSQLILR